MKNKNKIIIIASAALIIASVFITIKLVSKPKSPKYNIPEGSVLVENEDVLKDQTVGKFKITNALLYTENGKSKYTATVNNNSNEDKTINLAIVFHEENMKTEIIPLNNKLINANGKTNIEIIFEIDLTKIKQIEYILK
jgi:hypothetical protein